MRKIKIIPMAILTTIVVLAISCSPSRAYYYDRYPPAQTSLSLIISPGPGFVISHYPDGRYYYRSPEGYIYWRGWNNMYYLDRSYIRRVHYNQREYREWKNYDRWRRGRNRYH
ncbi:MAG: hypothetical protein JST17_09910 [Bacteroidetes bacterium]|nr:hypothetical protein [Bacteroidota bacterium]MBS1930022.1 hypothetical protein [Bacteroidota bacterium]